MNNNHDYFEFSNFTFPYTYSEAKQIPSQLKYFVDTVRKNWGIKIVQAQVVIFPSNKAIRFHLLEQGLSCKGYLGTVMSFNMLMNTLSCNLCPFVPTLIRWFNDGLDGDHYGKVLDIEYDTVSFTLKDYDAVMRNAFFVSDNLLKLEKYIKGRYSFIDFTIRWKEDEYYYLVFKNDSELEKNRQLIDSICQEINHKIAEMDYLNEFTTCSPIAVITSYEKLKSEGKVMGIMRNNVQFGTMFED